MRFGKKFLITEENVHEYIVDMGAAIKAHLEANGRKGVVLGMSGGIDCSVVARLCQEAGIDVYLSIMPYGNDMNVSASFARAMEFIEKYSFPYEIHDIQQTCDASSVLPNHPFAMGAKPRDLELAIMNRRPRARMMRLHDLAQLSERLVIGTSNLDEIITGYFTMWGDNANGYQPLAMLTKREVRILARALDVPSSIVEAAPSAGLYAGQTDEDELGFTYNDIDAYIVLESSGNSAVDEKIEARYLYSNFKRDPIAYYNG